MDEKTTLLQEVGAAFRDHGVTAAVTELVGGTIALLAAVTRIAFPNDAMLVRLDRELTAERALADRQRAEDHDDDADRLERIEADIRAMRDLMFKAFQRGCNDGPTLPRPAPAAMSASPTARTTRISSCAVPTSPTQSPLPASPSRGSSARAGQ